jgi:GDPmannose 4,6-dehydratase
MSSPTALITGITGQDGSFLARDLLESGYVVFGTSGSSSPLSNWRFQELGISDNPNLKFVSWDITNPEQTLEIVGETKPNEIYNLASHSFVVDSIFNPQKTTQVSAYAVVNILEAIASSSPETKFFQAGSSEMFGNSPSSPQNENSVFAPRNIYGSAKAFAHFASVNYRENRGVFSTAGILYNHESPLRGSEFVTKKITSTVAKIKLDQTAKLSIGNLSSVRDWGYAPEYVQAMRMVIGHDKPDTFVIASGTATTVRDFVRQAFNAVGIEIEFEGSGLEEVGYERATGRILVSVDTDFFRESEAVALVGDASKAQKLLGWSSKTPVAEITNIMVKHDLEILLAENR